MERKKFIFDESLDGKRKRYMETFKKYSKLFESQRYARGFNYSNMDEFLEKYANVIDKDDTEDSMRMRGEYREFFANLKTTPTLTRHGIKLVSRGGGSYPFSFLIVMKMQEDKDGTYNQCLSFNASRLSVSYALPDVNLDVSGIDICEVHSDWRKYFSHYIGNSSKSWITPECIDNIPYMFGYLSAFLTKWFPERIDDWKIGNAGPISYDGSTSLLDVLNLENWK